MNVDQFLSILLPRGDGIADSARAIRDYLRRQGYSSEIYVRSRIEETAEETRPLESYSFPSGSIVMLHYSDALLVDFVTKHRLPIYLFFHNITPDHFFDRYNQQTRAALSIARARLPELVPFTLYAAGDSRYTQVELQQLGFAWTGVSLINVAQRFEGVSPDSTLIQRLEHREFLLFVGRLAPNKRQEDLIRLLSLYRQLNPRCELFLVGSSADEAYLRRLRWLVGVLDLVPYVHFAGRVTQSELTAYYQTASVFVSMSEHEGFGIPLMESMLFGVPVVAYASSAVTEAVESAGILIRHKRLAEWAIVIDYLMRDSTLRQQVIAAQNQRAQAYSITRWEQSLRDILCL